ncbi:Tetracycline repressor protein class D [Thalassocella blandensis]|nr:Tetracycline repressor protein class D [Thalassocella blandensis]
MTEKSQEHTLAKNYHHGNLKEALIDGFLELLQETPIEKLSLRKLATHIGVAPTAVYNHFKNKEELAVAVKLKCLNHFAEFLDENTVNIPDARERVKELGKSYYRYSVEYSQYFSFIMSDAQKIPDEFITQEVIDTAMRAESALRGAIIHLLKTHNIPMTQYNEGLGAFACWAMAHGITSIVAKKMNHVACDDGRWPPEFVMGDIEQVNQSFEAMTDILIAGILHTVRK